MKYWAFDVFKKHEKAVFCDGEAMEEGMEGVGHDRDVIRLYSIPKIDCEWEKFGTKCAWKAFYFLHYHPKYDMVYGVRVEERNSEASSSSPSSSSSSASSSFASDSVTHIEVDKSASFLLNSFTRNFASLKRAEGKKGERSFSFEFAIDLSLTLPSPLLLCDDLQSY